MTKGYDWEAHPETFEKLKEMWEVGHTASEISLALGNDISRNAVIGIVHLHQLKCHKPVSRKPPPPKRIKLPPMPKPVPVKLNKPDPAIPPETFWESKQCQHITGDPCSANWQACGNPVFPDKKYCGYHYPLMVDIESTKRLRRSL